MFDAGTKLRRVLNAHACHSRTRALQVRTWHVHVPWAPWRPKGNVRFACNHATKSAKEHAQIISLISVFCVRVDRQEEEAKEAEVVAVGN